LSGAPHSCFRRAGAIWALSLLLAAGSVVPTGAIPRKDMVTGAGIVGMAVTNLGYVGNGFSNPNQPSCEYPISSHVEHLFLGGLWVGAETADGTIHVSTGAQDASNLVAGDEIREFQDTSDPVRIWSNSQNSDNYNPAALATQHIECVFDDYAHVESGNHVPLGLKVILRVLDWGSPYADDFVILDYRIVNISGSELRNVYVGYWNDTTVGNTQVNNPYDSAQGAPWNWYDDVNGGWRPGDVPDDPGIWMMYEHDDDGDDGVATSWIGTRFLGARPAPQPAAGLPPVSYNAWRFHGVPAYDDEYVDEVSGETLPGKYQIMGNGDFDVGETQEEDYTIPSDWVGMLSTGPFPVLAPDDTLEVTFAVVCGADSLSLLANSKVAQVAYDRGFSIPTGPPSPRLSVAVDNNTAVLTWAPGDSVAPDSTGQLVPLPVDDPRRSPEHHISVITGRPDFQGYRIYRFQGDSFGGDPYAEATLVAEFDKVDGIGFDTGLPPLDADGRRRFTDGPLLDGFPYWYAVVSFSAPDLEAGLPSFQSGFNENAVLVYPGPAPAVPGREWKIGVFPNPYRAGSLFDARRGEPELGRKIWFTGLPPRSRIEVYTLAGDLVRTLFHDDPATGMEAWNVLSEPTRAIASGLYIYVVENLDTGEVQRGKLVIVK